MQPVGQMIGYVEHIQTKEKVVTFYKDIDAQFASELLSKVYSQSGISIPGKALDNYPELKDRVFPRVYPHDGELFQKAFVDYELRRLNPPNQYRYIKI